MKQKIIIYQTFPRLFGNENATNHPNGSIAENGVGKMKDYSEKVIQSIKSLGCNYIWYTGLLQQATQTDYSDHGIPRQNPYVVKGKCGSPYAITDYYSVSPDLAMNVESRMQEFDELVERTHGCGMKMIIDFVPNHVARQYQSLLKPEGVTDLGEKDRKEEAFCAQNNFYYIPGHEFAPGIDLGRGEEQYREYPAKATGNDCFHSYPGINDWYETVKLNYGVNYQDGTKHFDPIPDTWLKMEHILRYWAAKGVDGFRCDMAHMVPVEFWEWVIPKIKEKFPEVIFIAELYDPALYRDYIFKGHFDYLYDKVGLYDTLRGVISGYLPATTITGQWQALEGIQQHMLNFLENHDEQRIASEYFAGDPFKAIPALIVSAMMNVNPFMIYFGQELGETGMDEEGFSGKDGRTSIFDYYSLDKMRRWNDGGKWDESLLTEAEKTLRRLYQRVLTACNSEEAIREGEFFDLMYANFDQPNFNLDEEYAFLRKKGNELFVIAVNFSDKNQETEINIPWHAFEHLRITPGDYNYSELLSEGTGHCRISPDSLFSIGIGAHSGVLCKIILPESQDEKK